MAIMRLTVQHHLVLVNLPQSLSSLTVMIGYLDACFPPHS